MGRNMNEITDIYSLVSMLDKKIDDLPGYDKTAPLKLALAGFRGAVNDYKRDSQLLRDNAATGD